MKLKKSMRNTQIKVMLLEIIKGIDNDKKDLVFNDKSTSKNIQNFRYGVLVGFTEAKIKIRDISKKYGFDLNVEVKKG